MKPICRLYYLSSFTFKANVIYLASVTPKIVRKMQRDVAHALKFWVPKHENKMCKKN